MSFRFTELPLPGLMLIEETRHGDGRGFFAETWRASAFRDAGIDAAFVQDNHARSTRGVLRGLHYQLPPHPQGKLIRVVQGEIFDVAVDLRRGSSGYGRWFGTTLSGEEGKLLWIPAGFAHGYLVLSAAADVTYKVTAEFRGGLDRGIRWDDPAIGIRWPGLEAGAQPLLSPKDRTLPALADAENPFDA